MVTLNSLLKKLAQKLNIHAKECAVKRFYDDERVADVFVFSSCWKMCQLHSLTDICELSSRWKRFMLSRHLFQQISIRFADFRQHVNMFFVLDPKQFYDDDDINSGNTAIVKLAEV